VVSGAVDTIAAIDEGITISPVLPNPSDPTTVDNPRRRMVRIAPKRQPQAYTAEVEQSPDIGPIACGFPS
jgi:hypothetical protein